MVSLYSANFHSFPELGEWHTRVGNGSSLVNPDAPADLLSLVTIIGSSMSLVGLVFGFLVHSLFSDVRSVASTGLMNMLATLFVAQVLFIAQVEKARSSSISVCLGLAYSLRFFWLAVFWWSSALVHHLLDTLQCPCHSKDHRQNAVTTTTTTASPCPSTPDSATAMVPCSSASAAATAAANHRSARRQLVRTVLSYSAAAWGAPLLFVLVIALCSNTPERSRVRSFRLCWIESSGPFPYTFDIPVVCLTVLNIYLYVRISNAIHHLASLQMEQRSQQRTRRRRFRQLFLHVKLNILLILVWLCGLASELSSSTIAWCIFVIGFSLQGGLIALVYSCNVRVMKTYMESLGFNRRNMKKRGLKQALSHTTSMELLTADTHPQSV